MMRRGRALAGSIGEIISVFREGQELVLAVQFDSKGLVSPLEAGGAEAA
jgi:hypothetical protein